MFAWNIVAMLPKLITMWIHPPSVLDFPLWLQRQFVVFLLLLRRFKTRHSITSSKGSREVYIITLHFACVLFWWCFFLSVNSTWHQGILRRFASLLQYDTNMLYTYIKDVCANDTLVHMYIVYICISYLHATMNIVWNDMSFPLFSQLTLRSNMTWCHHNSPSETESIEATAAHGPETS